MSSTKKQQKKENPLSVWLFTYKKSYYLKHPRRFFKDLYWNIRNFWHRGKYGFAYVDAWNWFVWWPKAGAEALKYIADHGSGYKPDPDKNITTKEDWQKYLYELADKLYWCAESCDSIGNDIHKDQNEYYEQHEQIMSKCWKEDISGPNHSMRFVVTDEDEVIIRKYLNRESELSEEDALKRAEIFSKIGKELGDFWD